MPHTPLPVYELAVVLDDRPAVQRRLRLSAGATLDRLHRVICVAFEWPISPIFSVEYGDERAARRLGEGPLLRLRQVLIDIGASLGWAYGDGQLWNATVTLEARHHANAQLVTPCCIAARGQAPRVDSDPWDDTQQGLPNPSCEAINAALLMLRT